MYDKKYELMKEDSISVDGHTLYRIRALRPFDDVNVRHLGGYIEKEDNLSHEGDCWVYDDAMVYGDAYVYDNAKLYNTSAICDNVKMFNESVVRGDAKVSGNVKVINDAVIFNHTRMHGDIYIVNSSDYILLPISHYTKIHNKLQPTITYLTMYKTFNSGPRKHLLISTDIDNKYYEVDDLISNIKDIIPNIINVSEVIDCINRAREVLQ